ncbi:MAG: hypothetical protein GF317_04635 [Candidatus Lokiarchaeota archaeon]|nr:hypothetical protein [Candidatus Lokiarchaeota archaeon]
MDLKNILVTFGIKCVQCGKVIHGIKDDNYGVNAFFKFLSWLHNSGWKCLDRKDNKWICNYCDFKNSGGNEALRKRIDNGGKKDKQA